MRRNTIYSEQNKENRKQVKDMIFLVVVFYSLFYILQLRLECGMLKYLINPVIVAMILVSSVGARISKVDYMYKGFKSSLVLTVAILCYGISLTAGVRSNLFGIGLTLISIVIGSYIAIKASLNAAPITSKVSKGSLLISLSGGIGMALGRVLKHMTSQEFMAGFAAIAMSFVGSMMLFGAGREIIDFLKSKKQFENDKRRFRSRKRR